MKGKGIRFSEYAPHCPACKAEPPTYEGKNTPGGFTCHACGASGDLFDWTMKAYGMTFQEALQKLHRDAFHPPN